jgi:hypothetical protein
MLIELTIISILNSGLYYLSYLFNLENITFKLFDIKKKVTH